MSLPNVAGVESARGLSAEGRWSESCELFARLDRERQLDGAGLAEFAVVSWMAGEFNSCLELYGRSYRAHCESGDAAAAAVVALALAWEHDGRGEQSQSEGWAARAASLLDGEAESVGH